MRETNGYHTNLTYAYLGGVSNEASSYFNRRSDAFQEGDEVSLSGIVPALNYPLYDRSNHKLGNYYLNGLSVKVQSYNSTTGEFEVLISFEDFTVRSDKRWCGFIDLNDINSGPRIDLVLDDNVALTIDKNGNANRLTKHPVFDDFVNPTIFTMKPNSHFMLKSGSSIEIKNYSVLTLESNSILDLKSGSKITVRSGCTLKLESEADLRLEGNACIEVEDGGYICVATDADISLDDDLSVINLRPGFNIGVNSDVLPGDPTSCITNPGNIVFTGSGSINTFNDDIYIQNEVISEDAYYGGNIIYMGREVDPSQSIGDVIIQSGNTVILDAEAEIVIDKGSEIEAGAEFDCNLQIST